MRVVDARVDDGYDDAGAGVSRGPGVRRVDRLELPPNVGAAPFDGLRAGAVVGFFDAHGCIPGDARDLWMCQEVVDTIGAHGGMERVDQPKGAHVGGVTALLPARQLTPDRSLRANGKVLQKTASFGPALRSGKARHPGALVFVQTLVAHVDEDGHHLTQTLVEREVVKPAFEARIEPLRAGKDG